MNVNTIDLYNLDIEINLFFWILFYFVVLFRNDTTCFEDLSNEILYDIFEYIGIYDVYQVFLNVNQRFQGLLIDSSVPIQIIVTNLSIPNVEVYYKNFLLPNKHRINLIHLLNLEYYMLMILNQHILTIFLIV